MAFAFDKTLSALGQNPDEGKANIFAPQGMGLTGDQGGGVQRSDASGDLSGGGSGTNTGEKVQQSNDTASNAAFSANLGRVKSPANLKTLGQSVEANKASLQNQANAYVQQNTGRSKLSGSDVANLKNAIRPSTADSALGVAVGGPQQYAKNSLAYWSQQQPGNVKTVDPFKSDLNLTNSTIENLGTDAGVQTLLRRSNGPEYSAGDAAFDQALLGQDTNFQKGREAVTRSYGGLQKFGDELGGGKTTEAGQTAANNAYGSYLTDMRKKLNGLNNEYTQQARTREAAIEAPAIQESARQQAAIRAEAAIGAMQTRSDPNAAAYSSYIKPDELNPDEYFTGFDANKFGWQDYLDKGQAATFQNIFSLLGEGDVPGEGRRSGGLTKADLGGFDAKKYRSDLTSRAQTAQSAAEAKAAEEAAKFKAPAPFAKLDPAVEAAAAQSAAIPQTVDTGLGKASDKISDSAADKAVNKLANPAYGVDPLNTKVTDLIKNAGVQLNPADYLKKRKKNFNVF